MITITSENLDTILSKLDNAAFFAAQGLAITKHGKEITADCPFCGEKAHFNLNPERGLWTCFKCGEKGNPISFVAKTRNISNGEAVRVIKGYLGMPDDTPPARKPSRKEPAPTAPQGTAAAPPAPPEPSPEGDAPARPHPYERLIQLAELRPKDHKNLTDHRGFSEETIRRFRFKSCGEYLKPAIEQVMREYPPDELIACGILRVVNGKTLIEKQLLQSRLLIPYLDEEGQAYHLRPHKLGFAGLSPQPYCSALLADKPDRVVLTEGEFKATALAQWGIPAVAVPGISSFGVKHFDALTQYLREHGVKHVTVIFDSETKSNSAYPNFKDRADQRYDTQYWAYIMAYQLDKAGFVARIGWLPVEWQVTGKIDFDGALAAGKTRKEIEQVIAPAQGYRDFLDSLSEEAQRIVRRKISAHFAKINIKRDFNRYVVTKNVGQANEYDQPITNFVINIRANLYTKGEITRHIELINEYNESSGTIPIEPGSMAGVNEFKKFLLARGNYVFDGSVQDLTNIWKFEFLRDTGELIYMPEQIGWIAPHGIWLFGNMAIKNGEVHRPDNDGIVWIDQKGFRPQSINATDEEMQDSIPSLSEKPVDIMEIAANLKNGVGGYAAYMGIGWCIATLFSKDIFAKYKAMPILFPHGKRESGKSTFMRWLMRFFGVETEGVSLSRTTTQNYIVRLLSYRSGLGTWWDEYRNNDEVTNKDGFFRSAYNRQISGKGTATAFQTKGFAVNASVAISGEELPKDNGLFTRLIPLQMSSYKRNREYYDWLMRNSEYFSGFSFHLLTNYDKYLPKIMEGIAEMREHLIRAGVTDRTAENWAICAAAFDACALQPAEIVDNAFLLWVKENCLTLKVAGEQEHILNQFWSDLNFLASEGTIGKKHFYYDTVENKLHLWLAGVYEHWAVYYKKKNTREAFDYQSIANYIKDEPYFGGDSRRRLGGNTQRRTIIIDMNQNVPESLKELAEVETEAEGF